MAAPMYVCPITLATPPVLSWGSCLKGGYLDVHPSGCCDFVAVMKSCASSIHSALMNSLTPFRIPGVPQNQTS